MIPVANILIFFNTCKIVSLSRTPKYVYARVRSIYLIFSFIYRVCVQASVYKGKTKYIYYVYHEYRYNFRSSITTQYRICYCYCMHFLLCIGFLNIIYSFDLHWILIHLIYIAYYTSMSEYIIKLHYKYSSIYCMCLLFI